MVSLGRSPRLPNPEVTPTWLLRGIGLASAHTSDGSAFSSPRLLCAGRLEAPLLPACRYSPHLGCPPSGPAPLADACGFFGKASIADRRPVASRGNVTSRPEVLGSSTWAVRLQRKRPSSARSRKPTRGKSRLAIRATANFKAFVRATWLVNALRRSGSSHHHRLAVLSSNARPNNALQRTRFARR